LNHGPLIKGSSKNKEPKQQKRQYLTYTPSNAIHTNTSDFRRWCRVAEWFKAYGPEAKNLKELY